MHDIEKRKIRTTLTDFFVDPPEATESRISWRVLLGLFETKDIGEQMDVIFKELSRLGISLCGGAITSLFSGSVVNDLDFYIEDAKLLPEAEAFFLKHFPVYFKSDNCLTFKRKCKNGRSVRTVQLITRFIGQPTEIFENFDFTVTTGAYSFATGEFTFGARFLEDIASRKLVYLGNSKYPICALFRTKKYQERGYKLPGGTVMHIALSIVRLEIKTYKELKMQLMGIDTMFLQNLLNQAKYDENIPVNYGEFLADAMAYLSLSEENGD